MSEDRKLFDAGDYNLFRYCHNDPEDLTDPMGLQDTVETNSPRQTSSLKADEEYARKMGEVQWAMSDLMHSASGAIGIGTTGYNYEQATQVGQLSKNAPSNGPDKTFGSREAVQTEKDAMITEANRWNETSAGWSYNNQCAEQAANMRLDLLNKVQPVYWDPKVVGGRAPFFSSQAWVIHHHAVLADPRPIASGLGFKAFMLDPYKNLWRSYVTHDPSVRVYSPQRFREIYPYHIPNEDYP